MEEGLRSQGTHRKPWSCRSQNFPLFSKKHEVRIAGTIICMQSGRLGTIAPEFAQQGSKLPYVVLQPESRQVRRVAKGLSTAKFKSFGVLFGFLVVKLENFGGLL